MSYELQIAAAHGGLTLTLDRPAKGNALSEALVEALHAALDRALAEAVSHIVLRGSGRHFCTGFDLGDLDEAGDALLLHRFVRLELLLSRLWSAPFPTIVVAHGRCVGAGADLVAACARRLIVDDASFRFPGSAFGIVLGTRRLAHSIGADPARRLVTTGTTLSAETACSVGLGTDRATAAGVDDALDDIRRDETKLDLTTWNALRERTHGETGGEDSDLAALVRSAARPGLSQRMRAYRDAARGPVTETVR